ncbi:hypothetical protein J4443_04595 [Candidatus Woesearchaeota archaeon]|nr:hypothetical protein [Candidatus Woesearchaeota archaeon]
MNKRGQGTSAANVAVLIALIALFLLIYILLLPEADRERILGTDKEKAEKEVTGAGEVLLSEFIGNVGPGDKLERKVHEIANVNLFTKEESGLITLSENIIVSKGFFGGRDQNILFRLDNPADILKAELYLVVDSGDGDLVIEINGNEFYRNEVEQGQIRIEIPLGYLTDSNNLRLSVSGTGSKSYSLREIKLMKKEEINNRVARRTFPADAGEKADMVRAIMRYSVFCDRDEDKVLRVLLNDNLVYSDVPFCNLKEDAIELGAGLFKAGVNNLDFETDGDYLIEGITVKTFSGGEKLPEYFFILNEEDFKRVRRGLNEVVASFEFSLKDKRKNFILEINGEEINVDTTDDTFLVVLSDAAEEENLIRIDAKNSFEILEFKVVLE